LREWRQAGCDSIAKARRSRSAGALAERYRKVSRRRRNFDDSGTRGLLIAIEGRYWLQASRAAESSIGPPRSRRGLDAFCSLQPPFGFEKFGSGAKSKYGLQIVQWAYVEVPLEYRPAIV